MTWQLLNGRSLPLDHTLVMGILNVTPDSFSDGGCFEAPHAAVERALEMEAQGAEIIDIGGQSTRPGAQRISEEEEWRRVSAVLEALRGKLRAAVSVDTFYPSVAEKALGIGAHIINDVTGFDSPEMRRIAAETGCGCIVMHHDRISGDTCTEVKGFFSSRVELMQSEGIVRETICLDPGIGFEKDTAQNLELLKNIAGIRLEGLPLLIAASRKRYIGEVCAVQTPSQRDWGTVAAHTVACMGGAELVRAHNVTAAVQAARIVDAIKQST